MLTQHEDTSSCPKCGHHVLISARGKLVCAQCGAPDVRKRADPVQGWRTFMRQGYGWAA